MNNFIRFIQHLIEKKITKVYIEQILIIDELLFFILLFTYVTFFKVDYIYTVDSESSLRDILTEINKKSSNHLCLLYFGVPTIDDKAARQLYKMIDDEQLLTDYTIKRFVNKIYIEWK